MPTPTRPEVAEKILNILDVLPQLGWPSVDQAWDCAYLPNALYVLFTQRLSIEQHTQLKGMDIHIRHHLPYTDGRQRYLLEWIPLPDDED